MTKLENRFSSTYYNLRDSNGTIKLDLGDFGNGVYGKMEIWQAETNQRVNLDLDQFDIYNLHDQLFQFIKYFKEKDNK